MTTAAQTRPGFQAGTLSALRYPNFRLYFIGQLISLTGSWMQIVAQGWLVFDLTKSELWLGIVACAAGLPALILSPFAGVLVDRMSRRKILLFSQTMQMILAFILAWLTFTHEVQVWHIVTLAFFLGVTNAIDAPARQTIIADLVSREELSSGIMLNSIMFNASRVFGPAAAGIALTNFGPAVCFFLNGASFLAVIFMLVIMQVKHTARGAANVSPIQRLKEGLAFSRQHSTIAPLLLLAVSASIFTANISQLLPAYADKILHSPEAAYANLSTAFGVGAVISGVFMAYLGRVFGRGRIVTAMAAFVMVLGVLFAFTTTESIAVVLIALFGFGIILEFVTVNTLIQSEVPDEFRGRVMSLYTLAWFGFSPFGALALGAMAEVIGTPAAMAIYAVIGGVLCLFILLRSHRVRALA